MDDCCCVVLVVLVDDEVLGIWCLGGRGAMLFALAFGLRGGVDPVTCSTLGRSVILGLARVLRGDVSSGLMRVKWTGLSVRCIIDARIPYGLGSKPAPRRCTLCSCALLRLLVGRRGKWVGGKLLCFLRGRCLIFLIKEYGVVDHLGDG